MNNGHKSLRTVIISCTAVLACSIIIAAALLRKPSEPQSHADPIRRAQLEEIVHLANRSVSDGYGNPDHTKFRPAVVSLENFTVLNSAWLHSHTNINVSLDSALFHFRHALDAIDGPLHRDTDYHIFRETRALGLIPLINAVNEL